MLESNLIIVPVLAAVVLGTMLLTARWARSSLSLGMLGAFGVLLGGPSTIVLLASDTNENVDASSEIVTDGDKKSADSESVETTGEVFNDGPARPNWVGQPNIMEGDVHKISVLGIDGTDFNSELRIATSKYISKYVGHSRAGNVLNWDVDTIKRRFLKETFDETKTELSESINIKHGLLHIDQATRNDLDRRWTDAVAKRRTLFAGLIGGSILAFLGVMLGYFRLDNATRGFYTGRLQFMAVAAILTLIAVSVVAGKWIPWS